MESNKITILARTKLVDRPITWKEAYTDRTLFLKKQFHEVLGPGSYFRFEGHDTDTGDEYFVIVGPAKVHEPKAEFFAGVRKLPANFSAGGLYFHDIKEAMNYAHDTWGVNTPTDMEYYDATDLRGIGKKVDKWKDSFNEEQHEEGYLQKWYENLKKGGKAMLVGDQEYFYTSSNTYPFFTKVAMPSWHRYQTGFQWWDIDRLSFDSDPEFEAACADMPSLRTAISVGMQEKSKRLGVISQMYGPQYANDNAGFYKIWLVHKADEGTYLVGVGPYAAAATQVSSALDKFGVFNWKLNVTDANELRSKILELQRKYAEQYGITLTSSDFSITGSIEDNDLYNTGSMEKGELALNARGREKFKASPEWRRQILNRYGNGISVDHPKMEKVVESKQQELMEQWKAQLAEARAVSEENGEAFMRAQPPPPETGLVARASLGGQLRPTTILRQNVHKLDGGVKQEKYGFDSMQEAVDYMQSTTFKGAAVENVPPTTSNDLKAARQAKWGDNVPVISRERRSTERRPARPVRNTVNVTPEMNQEVVNEPVIDETSKPIKTPVEENKEDFVKTIPDIKQVEEPEFIGVDEDDFKYANSSLLNMIKVAEELDTKGRYKEAEEIHNILKKHILL